MIIQINATVCAAPDHGDDRQHKIAGRDQRKTVQERQARGIDQGYKKDQNMRQNWRSLQPDHG